MHPAIATLLTRRPVITDGASGTLLQAAGLALGECPDAWNLHRPEVVAGIARSYADAGSDVVLTNTFRSNRFSLERHGLLPQLELINRAGVTLARDGAGGRARVFASVGPSGRMLAAGDVTAEELTRAFTEQTRHLCDAGAEGIVLETFSDLAEAMLALSAARATGLPVVVSMVFDAGRGKDRTMTGATVEQVARELTAGGADVVGANCGSGIEDAQEVCRRLLAATALPVWIKPNAGLPELLNGQPVYKTPPETFAHGAVRLRDLGASFIGGCCGTTPSHLHALSRRLRS